MDIVLVAGSAELALALRRIDHAVAILAHQDRSEPGDSAFRDRLPNLMVEKCLGVDRLKVDVDPLPVRIAHGDSFRLSRLLRAFYYFT
jgi:hypothetical protein